MFKLKCVEPFSQTAHILLYHYHYLHFLPIQQKVNNIIMDNAIPAQIYDVVADHIAKPDVTPIILFCCSQDVFPLISYLSATSFVSFVIVIPVTFIITINEQISNFAQTYPTNLKASSNEALLFMRRYRFANCSCFSCCFKDAYPSSNVQ